jgi:uncharacterized membrane protein
MHHSSSKLILRLLYNQNKHNMNTPSSVSASTSASMLCTPALVYLVISFVALVVSWMQNSQNSNVYCAGHVSCPVQNTTYVFILKILWFLFWTWILNVLCTKGYTTVAWVLVAIPFMVFFTLMFGLANAMASGSRPNSSAPASSPVSSNASYTMGITGTTAYNGKASNRLNTSANANTNGSANPGEYVYGNKADKVGFYPNETNTQYSSYSSYDANLDNRAKFLDRESKGLVQPQQQQQQQQQQQPQQQQ